MPLPSNYKTQVKRNLLLATSLLAVSLSGCASGPESVTTEHKGKVVIVHHRRKTNSGLVDHIEAINAKGVVTQADVHVYDIGRLPHGDNGVDEAHRYYRIVQPAHPNLMLPKVAYSSGPKSVYTPPNYVPPTKDQKINDAVAEANEAREKLEAATKQVQDRLSEDNNLRGELQQQIEENQRLQAQLNASMAPKATNTSAPQTDAEKAAQAAVAPLMEWGNSLPQQ
jgi:hypothetical protein